ncbi:MAG: dihydropteroate synthase [Nitrososphaeria archaeon]
MFKIGRNLRINLNEVVIMLVLNTSPESFFSGSVKSSAKEIEDFVLNAIKYGAKIIDVGGMSTAPYKKTLVPEEVELERVKKAMNILKDLALDLEISIDTQRSRVMDVALNMGATIVNDISGFSDPDSLKVAKNHSASVIAVAHGAPSEKVEPAEYIKKNLEEAIKKALNEGIDEESITVDPAIGFIRPDWIESAEWDLAVLNNLTNIKSYFNKPLLIGISRKSFIGKVVGEADPAKRLPGSLAAEIISVERGANIVRVHDVYETVQALKIAEKLLNSFKLKL